VPDWIAIDKAGLFTAAEHGPLYGYDAMRVAFYMVWSGRFAHPAVAVARSLFGDEMHGTPVRADPATRKVLERSDAPGYAAVAALILRTGRPIPDLPMPEFTAAQPYYPATLHLLAALAAVKIPRV